MSSPNAVSERLEGLWEEAHKISAFFRRDLLALFSYRMAFASDWIAIIVQVTMFAFVGRLVDDSRLPQYGGSPTSYLEFIAVGVTVASFVQVSLGRVVAAIRSEQLMGTLESLLMTPTAPMTLQLGSVVYDLVYVPVRTFAFLGLFAVLFDVRLNPTGVLPVMAILLAFVPTVWGIGMVSAAGVLTFRRGAAFVGLGGSLLVIASGTYFPVEVLPGPLPMIAQWNPITITLQAAREALLGQAGWAVAWPAITALAPMAMASLTAGVLAFRMALRRERKEGTVGLY